MQFSVASILAMATAAAAVSNVTYTTEIVTALTTFCPAQTTLTHNGKTYTITEATTLTITDCPCTVTKPVTAYTTTSCSTTPAVPVVATAVPYVNGTAPAVPSGVAPSGTGVGSSPKPSSTVVTAGAGKAALSGAAGAIALGAALLL